MFETVLIGGNHFSMQYTSHKKTRLEVYFKGCFRLFLYIMFRQIYNIKLKRFLSNYLSHERKHVSYNMDKGVQNKQYVA